MNSNKFRFNENTKELEIDPRYINDGAAFAEQNKYTAIRMLELNEKNGGGCDLDLTPLLGNKSICSLSIADNFKVLKANIDAIYTMENLSKLSFQDKKIKPDFSKLSQLKVLYIKYNADLSGFSYLKNLTHLLITSLSVKDCSFLEGLNSLKELRLSGGSVESMSGIEKLTSLVDVKIDHCSKLNDISSLGKLNSLTTLHVEKCKLLNDFSFLSNNKSIENLFVSDLDSISFVASMERIKSLRFWNLKDGDISPVLKTKSLISVDFYPDKKHYSHTKAEIKSLMG
ncbi:hypothetical protein ACH5Y9_22825 [Methylomonas sp. BW4-1]|uniref:hypothetical protein n=1 Tax=Methylomonas sp. BW4-1 TaxID=3376685 RepID=UPI004041431B